ncbi:hypothetical protein PLICRDRAFT_697776 [Plicaturopsis crispa FD-325 SS-3]|nr:hypothetical protein PLICRDRAFT_697776 [Plicaturopsis crispa FD-325 SS-3]
MPSSAFLSLPDDVWLEICAFISVTDVLSLKKTCRVLNALGSSDYLWHQLASTIDLPLDIPPEVSINNIPAAELQRRAVNAIKLDRNWRKPESEIKSLVTVPPDRDGKYFDEIQLIAGAKWLVTAERRRFGQHATGITKMSLWSLEAVDDVYRTLSFEVEGRFKCFAVARQKGGKTATIAITLTCERRELLKVYTVRLEDPLASEIPIPSSPRLLGCISRAGVHGIIHEVDVRGSVVAATLVDFLDNVHGRSYQILFFNTTTAVRTVVKPHLPEGLSRLSFVLLDEHVALFGVVHGTVFVRVYELPKLLASTEQLRTTSYVAEMPMQSDKFEEFGPLVAEYHTSRLLGPHDFYISSGSTTANAKSPNLSVLAFRSFYDDDPSDSYIFNITLDLSASSTPATPITVYPKSFRTRGATSVDHVLIGRQGRGVWLEHHWENDEVRLMKLSGVAKPAASVLLPSYPGLPFTPRSCQALSFDEITGRLCLALHTGEFYILDF